MNSVHSPQAGAARVLCAVTFHFNAARLNFLAEVLRSLSEFAVTAMSVIVITNTSSDDELALLRRLCAEILPGNESSVRSIGNLPHPFDLTWSHKTILAQEFATGNDGRYTHFIYLEDDIRLSFANFCYFVEFREDLRDIGLLPSFVRIEWCAALGGFVASDTFWPVYVPVQSHLRLDDTIMVNMPNPYNPCFILDIELAQEYVQSRSFGHEGSQSVCPWGVRERAAMGLCLENVPPPFQTRYVVPVSRQTGTVAAFARISHLPNNYANDPKHPLGKVRVDRLFVGARNLQHDNWWPATAKLWPENQNQYYLASHHDTILCVAEGAHRLCHLPFGIAPMNLVLELAGQRGRLLTMDDHSAVLRQVSFSQPTGEIRLQEGRGQLDLDIETFSDGSIGMRQGAWYVVAEMDGFVRNDRDWCLEFERFRLIGAGLFDGIALLCRHFWLSHSDRRIVTLAPQPIDFGGPEHPFEGSALAATLAAGALDCRRELTFGPARLRLVGKTPSLVFTPSEAGGDLPRRVDIIDVTGVAYRFSRFAPLVSYAVSGDDSAYERLHQSLESLAADGSYCGAVGIACDRQPSELRKFIPATFQERLIVGDPSQFSAYQPILSCEIDATFDAPVANLLIDLLCPDLGPADQLAEAEPTTRLS
jgi:hypothetical protein